MAGLVYGIYDQLLPNVTEIRVQAPGDRDIAAAEKTARWTSAAMVAAVAVISLDATVAIIGGAAVIMFSWAHRHANMVDPQLGTASAPSSRQVLQTAGPTVTGYTPGG
jgi:methyl coenzyme M reductase alpha subunit